MRPPAASDKGEGLQLDIYRATLGQARRCSFSLERNTSFITSYWGVFSHVSLVASGMSVPFCLFVHHFGTYWNTSTTAGLSVYWYGYQWISSSSTSRSEILLSSEISQHLRLRSAQNLRRMNTNDSFDLNSSAMFPSEWNVATLVLTFHVAPSSGQSSMHIPWFIILNECAVTWTWKPTAYTSMLAINQMRKADECCPSVRRPLNTTGWNL